MTSNGVRPGAARLQEMEQDARPVPGVVRDMLNGSDQETALAVVEGNPQSLLPVPFSKTSLDLPETLTFESWASLGGILKNVGESYAWWVGDWLLFGEEHFPDTYQQAENATGLDRRTLYNFKSVAKRVPRERRVNLTFGHHESVAALPPDRADPLLAEAAEKGWSRAKLREAATGPKPVPAAAEGLPVKPRTLLRYCGPDWTTAQIVTGILRVCFPDSKTALDITYGKGGFWDGSAHVDITGTDANPDRAPHGIYDYRDLVGIENDSYDVVLFDPPHLADAGEDSIMGMQYGTASLVDLQESVEAGVAEAWRTCKLGIVVKVCDYIHGQRLVLMTDWVRDVMRIPPYEVVHQVREHSLEDPTWVNEYSARNNGAVYLVFRRGGDDMHVARSA